MSFEGKVFILTGGLRGIGLQICQALQSKNATVVIIGSSIENSISALKSRGLDTALVSYHSCDLRNDHEIEDSIDSIYKKYGAIDAIIHNAAVINAASSIDISTSALDLMYQINARAAWLLVKYSFEFLNESSIKQVIGICPPINLDPSFLGSHLPYVATRYLAGMLFSGMAVENPSLRINTLWPKTSIDASDICNIISGSYEDMSKHHRTPQIMADACLCLIENQAFGQTGECFIDEEVLRSADINSFDKYELKPKAEAEKTAIFSYGEENPEDDEEDEDPFHK